MKKERPVYLDVLRYKYPNTAIVSILHRISGVILFLFIPYLLWMLEKSLTSGEKFQEVIHSFDFLSFKFLNWVLLASLIFHLVAGTRHILMDVGIGESHYGGRLGANLVFIISAILILLAGFWLW